MSTSIPGAVQACEDVARRCYYVSQVVWETIVRPKFVAWRNYRMAHPELASGVVNDANRASAQQDQALYVIFINALITDLINAWLMPATFFAADYRALVGSWDGRRCEANAGVCQVSGGSGPEQPGGVPGDEIAVGGSTHPHCVPDSTMVQQIVNLTQFAYTKALAMRTGPYSLYVSFPVIIPLPAPAVVDALTAAFDGFLTVYYDLWNGTVCVLPATVPNPMGPTQTVPLPEDNVHL